MAEEKLRRKIRAEAALGSLSVGPPLAGFKSDKDGVSYTLTEDSLLFCFFVHSSMRGSGGMALHSNFGVPGERLKTFPPPAYTRNSNYFF